MLRLQVFFLNLHVKAQLQLPPRLFVRTHDFHSLCGSCDCHGIESVCVCACDLVNANVIGGPNKTKKSTDKTCWLAAFHILS